MNIGFVSQALPYLPAREGFRLYCANILKGLARSHRIDLVTLLEPGDTERLRWAQDHCSSVHTLPIRKASRLASARNFISSYWSGRASHQSGEMQQLLAEASSGRNWDVLHVEGSFAGTLAAGFPGVKVLSVHDSWTLRCDEMLRCSRNLKERLFFTAMKLREPRLERKLYSRFDSCTVVGERDAQEVRSVVPGLRVDVIPNGTDTDYFLPMPVSKNGRTVVFHSHLGYLPNIAAAIEFAEEIFPIICREIPEARFHLVGAEPVAKIQELARYPGIELSANLPDLRDAVSSGDVYACPIRHGTGVKNKVLEAFAMGVPVVCYPDAIIGIDCTPGRDVLVAGSAAEFAGFVVMLLKDPERRRKMAEAGRELVEKNYSWAGRIRSYERLYDELIQHRGKVESSLAAPEIAIA